MVKFHPIYPGIGANGAVRIPANKAAVATIQRRIKWYKKYLPHYHDLLPPDAYISKYEDLYGLETYQQRLAQFDNMIAYLDIELDYNNVENFLSTDRRVFGKKAYDKIPNYQEMFDKYGDEKIAL